MFDIGLPEFMVLALVAIFVFGPDKLPEVARQAGRLVRQARTLANSARDQLADELGPEFRGPRPARPHAAEPGPEAHPERSRR